MRLFKDKSDERGGTPSGVREPAVAGTFYPDDAKTLSTLVDKQLAAAPGAPNLPGPPCAMICPHAGYAYSGPTAAANYKMLQPGQYARVVVLAPSHYALLQGASVGSFTAFRTPLGDVPVDTEAAAALRGCKLVGDQMGPQAREHSLEVQLPFLQKTLGRFNLVPLVVGDVTPPDRDALATALLPLWDERTLVVASSDFCHYGPSFDFEPFGRTDREHIAQLDREGIDRILALDADGFESYMARSRNTICGQAPISVLLRLAKLRKSPPRPVLAAYALSGDIERDYEHSVSYAAITFCETGRPAQAKAAKAALLSADEKSALLQLARQAVDQSVTGRVERPVVDTEGVASKLMQPGAAFVTLTRGGELRGCIGTIEPDEPLALCVANNAVSAATRDPRFFPVGADELSDIHIEINVLFPPYRVRGIEEFVLGKHGIILEKNGRRALFLPEVMVEQRWTPEETLVHLCLKAGLPRDAWRSGSTLHCFETEAFGESET
ncbi:MAG: AmmeMemoRadiSam system protein B [Verrucomicrobia bacterium]|nr:AmmeMemoRadiSam system protein B [Verrucomicrobiota bacterium]